METFNFYCENPPKILEDLADTPEMQRLKAVGMNCGCEYTSFQRFSGIGSYSRFTHSMGVGRITWHFTRSPAAAAAALLHDIATPVFAHTVDFMQGDYLLQESTESRTAQIISSSKDICRILSRNGLVPENVWDYHRYPIADNDSPRLSADRLEYTLGNGVNYGFIRLEEAEELYSNLKVGSNGDGEIELCFSSPSLAERFAFLALDCSKVYVSAEDRYSMQILSELLKESLNRGILTQKDFYSDEPAVIEKLISDKEMSKKWKDFTCLSRMVPSELSPEAARIVYAKKRRIDPLVYGCGRMSACSRDFKAAIDEFMSQDFSMPIAGR